MTTTLVSAFLVGAGKAATDVGGRAVTDAYAALKRLVIDGYRHADALLDSIKGLEERPGSAARRDLLAEELAATGAIDDVRVVDAAEAVIAAAQQAGVVGRTIGVDWQDVEAARLKLGKIRVAGEAIGFRAARLKITEGIELGDIDASGGAPGK